VANASAWHNGSPNLNTGAGYGLRVDASYTPIIFQKTWANVELHLSGQTNPVIVNLSRSAKLGRCPELRHKGIGLWFISNSNYQWAKGQPPRFTLIQRGSSNVFDVI